LNKAARKFAACIEPVFAMSSLNLLLGLLLLSSRLGGS
jgi:hypothetical protein